MIASPITEDDVYLFNEGRHFRLYDKLGARAWQSGEVQGTFFAVWAPNAGRVHVTGDFNHWSADGLALAPRGTSGIWEGFLAQPVHQYKYRIDGVEKQDPFGFFFEVPPKTATCVASLDYTWRDAQWMATRATQRTHRSPMSIYEVHLGSWQRDPSRPDAFLSYGELAPRLASHCKTMGFTHIELLPIMEHPFYGSWGYQTTGYFAPTSRFGTPQDFMAFIDHMHQQGIGVILDWVPSHFPEDAHALAKFDGTHLFEHADPRQGFHPDWKSAIFNYGRSEVRAFLISSALFWLDKYHVDGLRVDAVASMLYLDYSRKAGEWIPNKFGGRENLDAIAFIQQLNQAVYHHHPDTFTIAEESTAWPSVSRPTSQGGLGFGYKWDMGWMHDTLSYFQHDPVHRSHHQDKLTFRRLYATSENFVLSLSHDEVVYGKGSMLGKMPGDAWQKFANLRLLYAFMFAQPGKKLMFMGDEFGQPREWSHERGLDWHVFHDDPKHDGLKGWLIDLHAFYKRQPALFQLDDVEAGFEWIDCNDRAQSVLSFLRWDETRANPVVCVFNFTPVPRHDYALGVPLPGPWNEALNSDAAWYGGSGAGNLGRVNAHVVPSHGKPYALNLTLPPLGALFLEPAGV